MSNRIALAAALCLAVLPVRSLGEDRTQDREQARQRVHDTLRTQGQLSDEAMAHLAQGIDRHAGETGYGEAVSSMVRESLKAGCTGECLADAVRGMNGAMERGVAASEAGRQAASAARDRAGVGAGHGSAGERGMAQRDPSREMSRDRARDRAGAMGGGTAGAMGGGMRGGRH